MREFDVNEIGLVCYGVNGNRNYEYMWKSALESNVTVSKDFMMIYKHPFNTKHEFDWARHAMKLIRERQHSRRQRLEQYSLCWTDIQPILKCICRLIRMANLSCILMDPSGKWFAVYSPIMVIILFLISLTRALVDNWYLHEEVGRIFADTILAQTGTNYTLGSAANLFGEHFGTSIDYASFVGVQAAFTIALPGGGSSGFDVPENEIVQVLNETWTGLRNVFLFAGVHNWEEY